MKLTKATSCLSRTIYSHKNSGNIILVYALKHICLNLFLHTRVSEEHFHRKAGSAVLFVCLFVYEWRPKKAQSFDQECLFMWLFSLTLENALSSDNKQEKEMSRVLVVAHKSISRFILISFSHVVQNNLLSLPRIHCDGFFFKACDLPVNSLCSKSSISVVCDHLTTFLKLFLHFCIIN